MEFALKSFFNIGVGAVTIRYGVMFIFFSLLTACGGSGGGNNDPEPTDTVAPVISAVEPAADSEITDITQVLTFSITDAGSGVDPQSLAVMVNGADRLSGTEFAGDVLTLTPAANQRWERGPLAVSIQASDQAGNDADADFSYTVTPTLLSLPRAVPDRGIAPLTLSFYPDASVNAMIESFEWDFDNDGTYDISEPIGRIQSYRFDTPGSYIVRLKVTDDAGNESIGETTVTVNNAPPTVTAEASPSNGAVPLTVSFSVTASDNEGVASYAWDFDGDGTNEESSDTTGNTSHEYTAEAVHHPVLTVTDVLGASTKLQVPSIDVRAGAPGSPSISAGASPIEGKVPLAVNFTAQVTDPDNRTVSRWEWDFDGDGATDETSTTSGDLAHTYDTPGEYFARVKATLADNDTAEDFIRINVQQELALALSTDTIDTDLGESTTITTTLGGATRVSLVIENSAGLPVRTLVDNQPRNGGTHEDVWDGRDNRGQLVAAGQYRAILIHGNPGERFDLGLTSGGIESNPVADYASEFAPFAADPLEIEYAIDRASEVTAFLGYLGAGTRRLFTFYQREPKGRGSHQIIWNGENEDGVLIEPPEGSSGFLVGLFAYTLPDNAIVVKNAVGLGMLAAAPPILTPDAVTMDGSPRLSTLQFNLSRDARVTHTVNNADTGEEVYRKYYDNLPKGSPQLYWDAKTSQGEYVVPGNYRHGITAVDAQGNKSTTLYAMQRVYY